eukprot:CAMPEP_0198241818 /NCGR_PEP_ID=MMETSP1446-20131203/6512_1 /TAXON_ID=1461542 ORGANISM="Unidentified sp, Strain CCMP2111" /NCGR_SAMPLE_ID=MMETSP1446 /ASSEMBLY_ACC=CAM_ASM_001112 /LENGTH=181 /DNA_ID=CAMNT_0043924695 /DNA_START=246 /DNA_END=788 /DNA_ORIENTATION=+
MKRPAELWRLEDLPHQLLEGLGDLHVALCAGLDEEAPMLPREGLPLLPAHPPLLLPVHFVPDNHLNRVRDGRVHVDLVHPQFRKAVEGFRPGHIVSEDDALRAAVIAARKCAETLLTSRIPDGELHPLPVDIQHLQLEVHSYCGRHVVEVAAREPHEDGALPHAGVPHEEHLEQVVEARRR